MTFWSFLLFCFLLYNYHTVFFDGDGHTLFHIVEEFLAQAIHHRHLHVRQPHGGEDGACRRSNAFISIFFLKFENISGFAIKHLADRSKGGKANSRYFVVFDFGKVDVGDTYTLSKLV